MEVIGESACATKENDLLDNSRMTTFNLVLELDQDETESGNWFVDGLVGDSRYKFMLDTGAATTSMKYDDLISGFTSTENRNSWGAFAKNQDDLITIPKIQVDSIAEVNVRVARAPMNAEGRRNLLGMNFLKNYALHFLFAENKVEILCNDQIEQVSGMQDLFLGERYHPYVDILWAGNIRAKGVWDTGAGVTCFDSTFVKKHQDLFSKVGTSIGQDSSGAKSETPVYMMKEFTLGGFQFPASKVVVIDLSGPNSTIKTPMEFILGFNVLNKANWIFDFPNRRWKISKMLN